MEAMNLVEVVLNHGNEEEIDKSASLLNANKSSPIKGLDESVTITVTRTPGKHSSSERLTGKPANFALLTSPNKNGQNSDASQLSPREEMVCNVCERVFKYRAAFLRHEAQCGLPLALKIERAAVIEAKKMEKAVLFEKRKMEGKQEKPPKDVPKLNCQTCLKQFSDEESYKSHNFTACAAERATYTFACSVCKAKFKYKNHMRRHEDSHNNVRRYNCDVCTTAFLRPDHLKRHMMRMHGIVHLPTQNAPKNIPMQCPMCNKILSRRDHLLRHMRNVHHVNNDSRKRMKPSEPVIQGFSEGMMDLFRESLGSKGGENEDEDGSENQSMESQDGLLIDESYESVKRENDSPNPESEENHASQNSLLNGSHRLDEPLETPLNYSYNQFQNEIQKIGAHSAANPVMLPFSNGMQRGMATSFIENNAHNVIDNSNPDPKRRLSNSSDGNQNVLSNAVRNLSQNWISNFPNYNGWS